jgi:hypothetical protein
MQQTSVLSSIVLFVISLNIGYVPEDWLLLLAALRPNRRRRPHMLARAVTCHRNVELD